jgi:hypothetical protein
MTAKAPIGMFSSKDSKTLNPMFLNTIELNEEMGPLVTLVRHDIRFTHQKFKLVRQSKI